MCRCVKCGKRLVQDGKKTRRLRCDACRYFVDKEIRGETSRSFRFYFEYRLKSKQDGNIKKESD